MRTTVIPAQITTVEDKIVGNLNLTQIVILMIPVFWTTIVYSVFTPAMKLAWYKLPLVLIVLLICVFLSLRIKSKVVVDWIIILSRFNLRPRYYVFDKNDSYLRTMDLPVFEKKPLRLLQKEKTTKTVKVTTFNPDLGQMVKLENLMRNRKYCLSFRASKNGGVDVGCK